MKYTWTDNHDSHRSIGTFEISRGSLKELSVSEYRRYFVRSVLQCLRGFDSNMTERKNYDEDDLTDGCSFEVR